MKTRFFFFLGLTLSGLALNPVGSIQAAEAPRPNIILMMSDDMGFSDIGCYGSEIDTPVLDGLAADGVRFTQFYNTARCCPTRASLMTGLYPHQAGIGHMMNDKGVDGYRGDLNKRSVTIAEVLKTAGYGTYMSGKWHVTKHVKPDGPNHNWPRQRGFDRFFGTIHGAGSFWDPNSLTLDNTQISPSDVSDDFYYTEQKCAFAGKFIREHVEKRPDDPFFVYLPFTCSHWPMHARERDIEKYKGRYSKGWDALRAERHARMIEMGLVSADWPLSPRDKRAKAWEETGDLKAWQERRMEVYAAMIDNMDRGIGKVVETLKETGRFENTLMLFIADNGGCAEEFGSRGPADQKENLGAMDPKELQFDMAPKKTRDGWKVRKGEGVMPGPPDTYVAYGLEWANASNTPFREYKHWVHEGGISSPLIAHWPAGISRKGDLESTPGHLIDIMATCVDLSGAEYPETFHDGQKIQPMEGKSLAPAFAGNGDAIEREAIFWEHEGNRAVRVGDMKLVAKGRKGPWELYDLKSDRTELNDLASKMPEKTEELANLWQIYAERTGVIPWPQAPAQKKKKDTPPKKQKNKGAKAAQ